MLWKPTLNGAGGENENSIVVHALLLKALDVHMQGGLVRERPVTAAANHQFGGDLMRVGHVRTKAVGV